MGALNIDTEEVKGIASKVAQQKENLEAEIKGIQENKERLNTCWTGEAATAAQSSLEEIVNLYNDMLVTVTSTHESLSSTANAFSETDSSNASMFK